MDIGERGMKPVAIDIINHHREIGTDGGRTEDSLILNPARFQPSFPLDSAPVCQNDKITR